MSTDTHEQNQLASIKATNVVLKVSLSGLLLVLGGVLGYGFSESKHVDDEETQRRIGMLEANFQIYEQNSSPTRAEIKSLGVGLSDLKNEHSEELNKLKHQIDLIEKMDSSIPKDLVNTALLTEAVTLSATQSIELTKALTKNLANDLEAKMSSKDKAVVKTLAKSIAESKVANSRLDLKIKELGRKLDRVANRMNL